MEIMVWFDYNFFRYYNNIVYVKPSPQSDVFNEDYEE